MKFVKLLLCLMLCALLFASAGLCASTPAVVPVGETGALLVRSGGQALLIGGGDASAIGDILSDAVTGVVRLCGHAQHSGDVDSLAARYGAAALAQGESLPVDGAIWQDGVLIIDLNGVRYAFGSDTALDGAITYRCDGTLIPYAATTGETAVNIRKSASAASDKVGRLARGELLTVLDSVTGEDGALWHSVRLADGTSGYVRSDLVLPAPGEESAATAAPSDDGAQYIGNKNTKVFHRPTCYTLPLPKNRVYFDSRSDAVSKGFRACQNCNP